MADWTSLLESLCGLVAFVLLPIIDSLKAYGLGSYRPGAKPARDCDDPGRDTAGATVQAIFGATHDRTVLDFPLEGYLISKRRQAPRDAGHAGLRAGRGDRRRACTKRNHL